MKTTLGMKELETTRVFVWPATRRPWPARSFGRSFPRSFSPRRGMKKSPPLRGPGRCTARGSPPLTCPQRSPLKREKAAAARGPQVFSPRERRDSSLPAGSLEQVAGREAARTGRERGEGEGGLAARNGLAAAWLPGWLAAWDALALPAEPSSRNHEAGPADAL